MIDEFGGTAGVRDMGALEAAVFRPQTGCYEDPVSEAAALMENLVQDHPLLDSNKRTAVAAADGHLRVTRLELGGDSMNHHRTNIGLMESGSLDWRSLEDWLRANVEPTS